MKYILLLTLLSATLFFTACVDDDDDNNLPSGRLQLSFEHFADGKPLVYDKLDYTNEAGNNYEISEIQYFISDITLYKDGAPLLLNNWTFYHYVDSDIPSTHNWVLEDQIPISEYDSIGFTFGIKGEKNEPYMFVNYPESAMFWPIHLGGDQGGYHYLKLNGFWMDPGNFRRGFQFHLGVGQKQDANGNRIKVWDNQLQDSSYVFVQNWFDVNLQKGTINITENDTVNITLRMNVEEWFKHPNTYDFNIYGAETMEYQNALQAIKENGSTVFEISQIN